MVNLNAFIPRPQNKWLYIYYLLQRIGLSNMRRKEINQLLKDLGFYKKESPDSPVPTEFQMAPARQKTVDGVEGKAMEDTKEEL